LRDPTFSRRDRTPACDGQTDTRRQHIYRASTASRGKNVSNVLNNYGSPNAVHNKQGVTLTGRNTTDTLRADAW